MSARNAPPIRRATRKRSRPAPSVRRALSPLRAPARTAGLPLTQVTPATTSSPQTAAIPARAAADDPNGPAHERHSP
jgi:hypothetical protein